MVPRPLPPCKDCPNFVPGCRNECKKYEDFEFEKAKYYEATTADYNCREAMYSAKYAARAKYLRNEIARKRRHRNDYD